MSVNVADFENQPWMLNVANGTIDLRNQGLIEHRHEHMLTKMLPYDYDPNAQCPNWLAFLDRCFDGSREMVDYFHRAVGYTITGLTFEKIAFLLYGIHDTGKTQAMLVLRELLKPDYSWQSPENFIASLGRGASSIPNDLAASAGMRMVLVSETSQEMRLNEARLKALTGGNVISARFLHQEFFEFTPTYKIWIETNFRPVASPDPALFRRIRVIPFLSQIPREEQIGDFYRVLLQEMPGILAWAVRGCAEWQDRNLGDQPVPITLASEEYRQDSDPFGRFLSERCVTAQEARVRTQDIFDSYLEWARLENEYTMSSSKFHNKLSERGFSKVKSGGVMWWEGLKLMIIEAPPQPERRRFGRAPDAP